MIINHDGKQYAVTDHGRTMTDPEEILHFAANPTLEDAIVTLVRHAAVTWQAALHICYKQVAKHFKVNEDELYSLWVKHHGPTYGLPIQLGPPAKEA